MASFCEVNSVKILLLGTREGEKWLNLSYLKNNLSLDPQYEFRRKARYDFLVFFVVNDVFTELRLQFSDYHMHVYESLRQGFPSTSEILL